MSGININDLKYALDQGTVTVGEVAGYLAKHTSALIPSHGDECSCVTCDVADRVERLRNYLREATEQSKAARDSIAPLKEERDRARSERDAVQRRLDQERSDWAQKMGAMEEAFKERERALQHQVDELARKRQFRREETGDLSNTAERTCLNCGISDDNIVTGLIPVGKRGSYWCFPCLQDEHE